MEAHLPSSGLQPALSSLSLSHLNSDELAVDVITIFATFTPVGGSENDRTSNTPCPNGDLGN